MEKDEDANGLLRRTAYKNASNRIKEIIKAITETAEKQAKSRPQCSIRRPIAVTKNTVKRKIPFTDVLDHPRTSSSKATLLDKEPQSCRSNGRKRENRSRETSGQLKRVKSEISSNRRQSDDVMLDKILRSSRRQVGAPNVCVVKCEPPELDVNGNSKLEFDDPALDLQLAVVADSDGDRPLHLAVINGDLSIVERLIGLMNSVGVPVDIYNYMKQTSLHLACMVGESKIVRKLLDSGSKFHLLDRNGDNCVHLCVKYDRSGCLASLLDKLSERNETCAVKKLINSVNYDGLSPLHVAVIKKNEELVKFLINYGADINNQDKKSGRSVLHWSVLQGNVKMVQLLLSFDADVILVDYSGITSLMSAQERGFCRITNLLENKVKKRPKQEPS